MSTSIYQKVGIASLIMMASVFLSRFFGLFRLMAIAYVGGRSGDVDAYQVAFVIPEILNHIVASGFLSITFIPIFSEYLLQDQEEQGWQVFSIIFTCFGSLLLGFIIIAHVLAPDLVALLARGRPDPVFRENVVRMTRIILPAQFFFFSGGLFMAVQFAKEKFLIPALAPLIYNLGIIAGGFLLGPRIGMEVMLGLTMFFSMEILIKFFGSYLPAGSIADLEYSQRTMLFLVAFFGQALGVASYPYMARLVVENQGRQLNQLLNSTLRYLGLVIPFSVLLMVLRREVILILFQRGQFDTAATGHTATVLSFMLVGSFAFAANTIVPRAYYAKQDTLFPAIYGTIAVLVSIPLYLLGLNMMGANGVALAASLSAILQVSVLYALWNRKNQNEGRPVYLFFVKLMVFSVPLGFLLSWFKSAALSAIDTSTLPGSLSVCIIVGAVFVLILFAAGYIFRIQEITGLVNRISAKLKPPPK
jgi:putative peptidoglycan lipid II flippase